MATTVTRKNLHRYIDIPVFHLIEKSGHHHSGIIDVSVRLTSFAGNKLPFHSSTLVDKLLLEAVSIWHANLIDVGIDRAYSMFCQHILNNLPSIFDYTVVGFSNIHATHRYTWDCLNQGFYEWIESGNINLQSLQITYSPASHKLAKNCRAFLLAPHVFSRSDFEHIGLASEQHLYLPNNTRGAAS
jgi:hypothetical protein